MGLQAMSGDVALLLRMEVVQNDDYKWSTVNDREEAVPGPAGSGKESAMKMSVAAVLLLLFMVIITPVWAGPDAYMWTIAPRDFKLGYAAAFLDGIVFMAPKAKPPPTDPDLAIRGM